MAIQAQVYPENLGLPLMGGGGSQDWWLMSNNNIINNTNNNNNNNLFFNGCGFNEFSFNNLQQKYQEQFQYQQQQQQQQQYLLQLQNLQQRNSSDNSNFMFLPSSKNQTITTTATTASTTTSGSDHMPMSFSQSFSAHLENQRHEIDRYITLQNERLKVALQEQRKQQLAIVMRKLEATAMQLLRQKDDEIAKETKRTMELEEIMRKMEVENQAWQRLAAENEAMVVSLNNRLEQIKEQACCLTPTSSSSSSSSSSSNGVEDEESCCEVKETGVCRVCNSEESCVLLLPCRHLCSCKACEAFLDACPVCKSPKMASIKAMID